MLAAGALLPRLYLGCSGTAVAARARLAGAAGVLVLPRLAGDRAAVRDRRPLLGVRAAKPRQSPPRDPRVPRVLPGAGRARRNADVGPSLLGVALRRRPGADAGGDRRDRRHGRAVGGRRVPERPTMAAVDVGGRGGGRCGGTDGDLVGQPRAHRDRPPSPANLRRGRHADHARAAVRTDDALRRPGQPRHDRRRPRVAGARRGVGADRRRRLAGRRHAGGLRAGPAGEHVLGGRHLRDGRPPVARPAHARDQRRGEPARVDVDLDRLAQPGRRAMAVRGRRAGPRAAAGAAAGDRRPGAARARPPPRSLQRERQPSDRGVAARGSAGARRAARRRLR